MEKYLRIMLKQIILFTLFIALFSIAIAIWFVKIKYIYCFLLGLIIALLNFIANSMITHYIISKKNGKHAFFNLANFFIRALIIGIIAVMLLNYSKFYVIAYVLGYISHFAALILYGISLNKEEGK